MLPINKPYPLSSTVALILHHGCSHFRFSSTTKTWINCSKFSRVRPRHGGSSQAGGWSSEERLSELGFISQRIDGLVGTQKQPAGAYRKVPEKTQPNSLVNGDGRARDKELKF